MSGDAARKSACATRVARTLVFAAFALMRTHGISMLKFFRRQPLVMLQQVGKLLLQLLQLRQIVRNHIGTVRITIHEMLL
jgi:hypothetical protein